ncbi:hypothetical protein KR044_001223, partial [Drosophila immigrans]
RFHEQKLIEKYYRDTELLSVIEEAVSTFTSNYIRTRKPEEALAPILIRLNFEYTDLVKHGQSLLQFIYREPLQFAEAVKYSVYGVVRDLLKANNGNDNGNDNGPKTIDIAQLHTQWRLLDIPLQKALQFRPTKFDCPLGLSQVHGILSAYTTPEILVLQSIWYCSGNCKRNAIQSSSTEAPLCPNCSRSMSEYQKLRVTENYCIVAILPSAAVETLSRQPNRIYRPVLIRLRAHVYDCELKLGACYLVTGYYNSTSINYQFESCHLRRA